MTPADTGTATPDSGYAHYVAALTTLAEARAVERRVEDAVGVARAAIGSDLSNVVDLEIEPRADLAGASEDASAQFLIRHAAEQADRAVSLASTIADEANRLREHGATRAARWQRRTDIVMRLPGVVGLGLVVWLGILFTEASALWGALLGASTAYLATFVIRPHTFPDIRRLARSVALGVLTLLGVLSVFFATESTATMVLIVFVTGLAGFRWLKSVGDIRTR